MKKHQYVLLLVAVFAALGCGCEKPIIRTDTSIRSAKEASNRRLRQVEDESSKEISPHFPDVELFINNRKYGETNGCISRFTPKPVNLGIQAKRAMKCGHPGAVSKVIWKYLESDDTGDQYEVQRISPFGDANENQQWVPA